MTPPTSEMRFYSNSLLGLTALLRVEGVVSMFRHSPTVPWGKALSRVDSCDAAATDADELGQPRHQSNLAPWHGMESTEQGVAQTTRSYLRRADAGVRVSDLARAWCWN